MRNETPNACKENIGCQEKSKKNSFNLKKNYKSQNKWHMKPPLPVRKIIGCQEKSKIFFFHFEKNYKSQDKWDIKPPLPVRKMLAVRKNFEILFLKFLKIITSPRTTVIIFRKKEINYKVFPDSQHFPDRQ